MNPTFVFIQKHSRFPVLYAAEHCAALGFSTVVIGEDTWNFRGCTNEPITAYVDGVADFERCYIHASPNTPQFEMFCFSRWLILRNYMLQHRVTNVIYVDSDALVYPGVQSIAVHADGKMLDTPFLNFFRSSYEAESLVNYMLASFDSPEVHSRSAIKDRSGNAFYTDMVLFPQFAKAFPDMCHSWARSMESRGFDSNINRPNAYTAYSNHPSGIKRVDLLSSVPTAYLKAGQPVPFHFLHFQSHSKPLMQFYLHGDKEEYSLQWWPTTTNNQVLAAMNALTNSAQNLNHQ
jgi:hypothetical protein